MSIDFLITSFLVALVPGTGVVFTVSTALARGLKFGVWAAIGCTLGIIPALVASLLGLAALMNSCALAYNTLKYVGVCYLLYVAWQMWKNKDSIEFKKNEKITGKMKTIQKAILINLLNPKLTLFFFAFLPQFVSSQEENYLCKLTELSGIFMLITLLVFLGYGCIANLFRTAIMENQRAQSLLNKTFASMIALFGAKLAFSDK